MYCENKFPGVLSLYYAEYNVLLSLERCNHASRTHTVYCNRCTYKILCTHITQWKHLSYKNRCPVLRNITQHTLHVNCMYRQCNMVHGIHILYAYIKSGITYKGNVLVYAPVWRCTNTNVITRNRHYCINLYYVYTTTSICINVNTIPL